jgi:isopenicillin N synthase-like dioxygenase
MPHSAFDTLPIIDLSLANNPDTKHRVLDELRHAVFNVGFMYIKNAGIPDVPSPKKQELNEGCDLKVERTDPKVV